MRDLRGLMSVRDWTLWAVLGALMVLEASAVSETAGQWLWTAVSVLAVGLALAVRRDRPLVALVAAGAVTCVELLQSVSGDEGFKVVHVGVLVMVSYLAGRRVDDSRRFVVLVLGALLLLGVVGLAVRGSYPLFGAILNWLWLVLGSLLFVILPWLYGRYRSQHARLVSAGWERAERMESDQRMAVEQARLRERNRIAQDMHDSLGHDLSLIALRAGALEVDSELAERHRRSAGDLRAAAAAATERLGDLVGVLRADEGASVQPVAETVDEIVERAQASGLAVDLHEEGDVQSLAVLPAQTVARVTQEGLTNAAKHAPGAPVTLRLRWASDVAVVHVRNPLVARTGQRPPSGGHGLTGLEERLRLVGGELSYATSPDGFELTAHVPYDVVPAARDGDHRAHDRSETASEHELVRERARKGLLTAIAAPVAVGAVIGVVMLAYYVVLGYAAILDEDAYERIEVGQERSQVEGSLPGVEMIDPPSSEPEPDDATCEYYRSSGPFSGAHAYRLCFEGDVVVAKDRIRMGSVPMDEERS